MISQASIKFTGTAKLSHQLILRRQNHTLGQQDYLNMEAVLDAHGPDIQKLNPETTLSYIAKQPEKMDTFLLRWALKHLPSESNQRNGEEDCFLDEFQFDHQLGQALVPESPFSKLVKYFILMGERLQPFCHDSSALPGNMKLNRNLVKNAISSRFKIYRENLNQDAFAVLPSVQYFHDLQQVLKSQKRDWELLPKSVQIVIDAGLGNMRYGSPYSEQDAEMTPALSTTLLAVKDQFLANHEKALNCITQNSKYYLRELQEEKMVLDHVYIQFKDRNGEDVKLLLGKMPTGLTHQGYTAKEQQEMVPLKTIDAFYKACFENALQWVRVLKPEGWQTVAEPLGTKEI
jgi:hypothetical protein